ncbi:MAG: caspase family protein [Terriglobia bacterium]
MSVRPRSPAILVGVFSFSGYARVTGISVGASGPFSAALSRHIGTPGLEVQQMLTRVRAEVVATTKNKQVPWSNSSLLGEVYLAEK